MNESDWHSLLRVITLEFLLFKCDGLREDGGSDLFKKVG